MLIHSLDPHDSETVDALVELLDSTKQDDRPDIPAFPRRTTLGRIQYTKPGFTQKHFGIWEDTRLIAYLEITFPTLDNRTLAFMELTVAPDRRRQGLGTMLWERAQSIAAEHDRTTVTATAVDSVPGGIDRTQAGKSFLEKHGFSMTLQEDFHFASVNYLSDNDIDNYMDQIRSKLAGYEMLSWAGDVPDKFRTNMLRLERMILSNIPTGDMDLEEEQIDAQRTIERDKFRKACGIETAYTVVRHTDSQLFVGFTVLMVYPKPATHAFQGITLVDGEHRGLGLGMALKLENLKQLRNEFPRVTETQTGTASVNDSMNAINAKFGYAPRDTKLNYQFKL